MSVDLDIDVVWGRPEGGPDEEAATTGELTIRVGNEVLTRLEDTWAAAVRPSARVSVYPLAMWLTTSWWRLRWEPSQFEALHWSAGTAWKMSHDLPAAGGGYVWPMIRFTSDGEEVTVSSRAHKRAPAEPVEYLTSFEAAVSAVQFERSVSNFIEKVLARLDQRGLTQTELHDAWHQLTGERRDPAVAGKRRLEAQLGVDPEDLGPGTSQQLQQLQAQAGEEAAYEIASAVAGGDASRRITELSRAAAEARISARLALSPSPSLPSGSAWERGHQLARWFRAELKRPTGPLTDEHLAAALELDPSHLRGGSRLIGLPGLGVRDTVDRGQLRLQLSKGSHHGRRFELARLLADALAAPRGDSWLPATSAKTARQKQQRAFAAELLVPQQDIKDAWKASAQDEVCEELSERYDVSTDVIRNQLGDLGLRSEGSSVLEVA